jgi:hypothetical protein
LFRSEEHTPVTPEARTGSNGSYLQIISPTNPVHEHEAPSQALQPLAFLLGHFYGEGHYVERPGSFQKEVTGVWEANGRFISLRMGVNYPLLDGRNDCHQALVIIGADPKTHALESRAYTDGGFIFEHPMELHNGALQFPDRPPGHGNKDSRARKVLCPTAEGYEERLELEQDNGAFAAYSILLMRRVSSVS